MNGMNFPLNRWTIAIILGIAAWIGGDLWNTIIQLLGAFSMAHTPAV